MAGEGERWPAIVIAGLPSGLYGARGVAPGSQPFLLMVVLLSAILLSHAWAADACRVGLHLDFSDHRSAAELEVLEPLIDDPGQLTPTVLGPFLTWLTARDAFMHLHEQLARAEALKTSVRNREIDWIGIEYSPAELSSRDAKGRSDLDRFQTLRRGLQAKLGADQLELALLLFAGSPGRYVWLSDPEVRRRVRLVPLDSDELKASGLKLLREEILTKRDTLRTALKYFAATDAQQADIFARLTKDTNERDITDLALQIEKFGQVLQDRI